MKMRDILKEEEEKQEKDEEKEMKDTRAARRVCLPSWQELSL